jgi:DNA helicase-2/ATP-dependent DNA helicase PcrA
MTIHSAKGLEFPVVFLPGLENGVFPSMNAQVTPDEMEEERRLAYVAVTRAKEKLFITHTSERMLYGRTQYNPISQFVKEIPDEYLDKLEKIDRRPKEISFESINGKLAYNKNVSFNVRPIQQSENGDFVPGDRVKHMTFGEGSILSVKKMGSDTLYEIAFDTVGTKKMMKTYARLKKI